MKSLLKLIKLLAPFRWWIALAVLLSFATVGSSVGLMAVSAYLISKAALANQVTDLALAITGVRFFAIARAGFRYAERFFSHTATFRILTRLRVWFYQGIEPLAPAQLMRVRSGDLLARITADIETLENFYIRVVVPPLAAALVTALACFILGSFSPLLGVALLAFLLLTGVALPLLTRWLGQQPGAQSIAQRAELNATLVDQIQGMADLLAFGQENAYQSQSLALGQELNRLQERMALIRGLGNGLAALLTSLAGLTVLAMAIPLVSGGQIDGVFLALIPLTAIASFEAVQPLSQAFQNLEASRTAADRIFDLLDAPPEVVDRPGTSPQPIDYSIEVQNLSFRYGPDEPLVLEDVSFSVPARGRVALVGPSGAGKSTLVHLLLRFWEYHDGHIRLGGHELRDYQADDVRRNIAVVSQQTYLFNTSIRDNLLLADADASDEKLVAACQEAQIHDFLQALPQGYDTLVGENGLRLSGGERQRLAIARALLKDAPIIILDEATAHLDPVTERQVWQAVDRLVAGRTLLVISHHLSSLTQLDAVVSLGRGDPGCTDDRLPFSHETLTKTP